MRIRTDEDDLKMKEMLEDRRRTEKIESELRNKKRPWFIRQWWHRNIIQWASLFIGILFGVYTILKPTIFGKPWDWADLIIMIMVGFNINMWLWGGLFNKQQDFIDELLELQQRLLKFTGGLVDSIRYGRPYID